MSDGTFEAKLYSVRKSKDGMIVAFVVQPQDTAGLTNLDIGAHLMIGWAEYAENEAAGATGSVQGQAEPAGDTGLPAASDIPKKRTPFHELPLSQQAGIRAGDNEFVNFLIATRPSLFEVSGRDAAQVIRSFCQVDSRAELATNTKAMDLWCTLNRDYESWCLEKKYKDVLR